MKATGIVRRIDDLGRVVIPKELRNKFGWEEGVPVEIFVEGETVMMRKYEPGCTFCGSVEKPMMYLNTKGICTYCADVIKDQVTEGKVE
jgi:AbrB family transcriptional regulator, transcriptional pleiotropic regulator of transition state genes